MTYGYKVEGGDLLGKTIVFARNNKHAEFIVERFNKIYPEQPGDFARVISYKIKRRRAPHRQVPAQGLRAAHGGLGGHARHRHRHTRGRQPGFRQAVRSKTKFWQMIGRGTRLCKDLFGPGQDKQQFLRLRPCPQRRVL